MALGPLFACLFFLGCYASGRLVRAILAPVRKTGAKTRPAKNEHPTVQLMSLAEWLSEGPHDKTGR